MLEKLYVSVPPGLRAQANKKRISHEPPHCSKADFIYTKCYCEENVYFMIAAFLKAYPNYRTYACFISNNRKQVPVWHQGDELVTCWDYHVICILVTPSNEAFVYDLDSSLAFPSRLDDYVRLAFRPEMPLLPIYDRMFRLVPGELYLRDFASDRSHMKDSDATPPAYPAIRSGGIALTAAPLVMTKRKEYLSDANCGECTHAAGSNTLPAYIDMTYHTGPGQVVDLKGLTHMFRHREFLKPNSKLAF